MPKKLPPDHFRQHAKDYYVRLEQLQEMIGSKADRDRIYAYASAIKEAMKVDALWGMLVVEFGRSLPRRMMHFGPSFRPIAISSSQSPARSGFPWRPKRLSTYPTTVTRELAQKATGALN